MHLSHDLGTDNTRVFYGDALRYTLAPVRDCCKLRRMADANAGARAALESAIAGHPAPDLAELLSRRGLGAYGDYAATLRRILALADGGAGIELLGQSVHGQPLVCVRIGPPDAPVSALLAGLHPTEWIGIETGLRILENCLGEPASDRQLVAFPLANPDGVLQVQDNLLRGIRRFVRHNARGVDLNRNFPSFWGANTLAQRVLRRTFAGGSGPASEPEVRAIVQRLSSLPVDRALSLHSFGGVVLFPYGAMRTRPVEHAALEAWARRVAAAARPKRGYRAVQSARWVPGFTARGMELDYFHEHFGALSLLIECSKGGVLADPWRPSVWTEPFAWFNPTDLEATVGPVARAALPFLAGDPL